MPNGKATIKQSEITRALKAAKEAGLDVARYDIDRDGRIRVFTVADQEGIVVNDWDRL